jgi:AcrR family transcriptional regulator
MPDQAKPLRADAARNRAKVLEVAYEAFAVEGLDVPIDEIARRARVGAGTVYRHFPTKEALFEAIATDRFGRIIAHARALLAGDEPGRGLFVFLASLIDESASDQVLADAFMRVEAGDRAVEAEREFLGALGDLLLAAQEAGTVRGDLDVMDLKLLLVGGQAMQRYGRDPLLARRALRVMLDGLEP